MQRLYYVRHGLSLRNKEGIFGGRTDTPLSDEGREQACHAGKDAKKLNIDYIVCSPLIRAHETAQIIASEIGYPTDNINVNQLFTERDFGELEGKPWAPDLNLDGFSDMETVDDLLERSKLAIEFLNSLEYENVLVVAHGSFGRALKHHLFPDQPYQNKTSNHKTALSNAQIIRWV